MDVIGPEDGRSTETATSGKLTNGNATSTEQNATAVAVAAAIAGSGSGKRKKAKRKNKAKNSLTEPELTGDENATIFSPDTIQTGKPLKAVQAAKEVQQRSAAVVNSNCNSTSSNHSISHSNGLPEGELVSIDAISKKLEQCVQIGRNGLTNGLPNHGNGPSDGASSETAGGGLTSPPVNDKGTAAGRKKNRSRQAKKGHANTEEVYAENGNVPKGKEEVKSQPTAATAAAFPQTGTGSVQKPTVEGNAIVVKQEAIKSEQQPSVPNAATVVQGADAATTSACNNNLLPTVESKPALTPMEISYRVYESERQMPAIMALIQKDLSEPYSIYTYRYFIHNWPKLCFLALHRDTCVGAIVCKLDIHRQETRRGYIAMLAVDKDYRKLKIGTTLVQKAIQAMVEDHADEVVLETEITNQPALRLYENLGFVRDKRLFHYYLNGVDALRLKLWFR
uniref:N-terminal methionine N(alpha)-acetyltransferase NatC n=1 Tax=Anopheles epiroticus TaxID=199890 RepID=A0A182PK53_9DIPT